MNNCCVRFLWCCWLICSWGHFVHAQEKPDILAARDAYQRGDYPEAMKGALAIYENAVAAGDQNSMADAGNLIGLVDLAQGQPKIALGYFRRALQTNTELNNTRRMAANLLNISLAYGDLNELDSAVLTLKASLKISTARQLNDLIAMGRNHLGDFYLRQHKLTAAEAEFNAVLNDKKHQSDWENSFACTGMAKLFFAKKRYDQAAEFADRANRLAMAADAKWDAVQALELAHRAYRAMGDDRRAYDRLLEYKTYSDSLFNAGKDRELHKLQLKEKSFENQQLQDQRKIDRLIIATVVIALLLLILFAVLIYRRNRLTAANNRRLKAEKEAAVLQQRITELQKEELDLINQDNNRLFSIIGHDLRSPFASIESTLSLFGSGDLDKEELVTLSAQLSAQLHTVSGMLNSLLTWSASQMRGMSFQPVSVDLISKVDKVIEVSLAAAGYKKIQLQHDRSVIPMVTGDADQIRIMIQNLIANAIKFTRENGTIRIYYAQATDYLDLIIEDNGVGMSAEKLKSILTGQHHPNSTYGTGNEKGIGLGLHIVRDFAAQNDIVFLGESIVDIGTKFMLRFKKYENR